MKACWRAAACAACWNFARGRYTEAVLLAMWIHGSLLAARNIPIFMLVAAPLVAEAAAAGLRRLAGWNGAKWVTAAASKFNVVAAELTATEQIPRWHLVSLAGVALVVALLFAPHPPAKFRAEFNPQQFPVAAVQFLGDASADRIFTFDQWGDYLIYALYPHTKVFVDGRSDFYGAEFEKKYIDVLNVKYGWQEILAKFSTSTPFYCPPVRRLPARSRNRARGASSMTMASRWSSGPPRKRGKSVPSPATAKETAVIARSRKLRRVIERSHNTITKLRSEHNDVFAQLLE